jgi:hypothetical protein
MKRVVFKFLWIVTALLVVSLGAICVLGSRVTLTAVNELTVDSYPIPDPQNFPPRGKLKAGQKLKVIGCDELKSYTAIHVQLDGGVEGYVIDGKYSLEFSPVWKSAGSPISFSCSAGPY